MQAVIKTKVHPKKRHIQYKKEVFFLRERKRLGPNVILKNNPSIESLYKLTEASMKAGFVHNSTQQYAAIWKATVKGSKQWKSKLTIKKEEE